MGKLKERQSKLEKRQTHIGKGLRELRTQNEDLTVKVDRLEQVT